MVSARSVAHESAMREEPARLYKAAVSPSRLLAETEDGTNINPITPIAEICFNNSLSPSSTTGQGPHIYSAERSVTVGSDSGSIGRPERASPNCRILHRSGDLRRSLFGSPTVRSHQRSDPRPMHVSNYSKTLIFSSVLPPTCHSCGHLDTAPAGPSIRAD
jgi:hypothetical protein